MDFLKHFGMRKTAGMEDSVKERVAGSIPKKMVISGVWDSNLMKLMFICEVAKKVCSALVLVTDIEVTPQVDWSFWMSISQLFHYQGKS